MSEQPFIAAWQTVTCSRCGRTYRCTPADDYYGNTTATDGLCEKCLIDDLPVRTIQLEETVKIMGNFVPYRMAEVEEYPSAECLQDGCAFTREPGLGSNDQAKEHVRVTGHKVKVTRSKISIWKAKS